MTTTTVLSIGGPRLTMGFDRFDRLDLDRHRAVHGGLPELDLDELIEMAEKIEMRGRGGAAFPFARKIMAVARRAGLRSSEVTLPGERREGRPGKAVVVVNGAEGEPGSAKDKVLLTRAPHLVLDGAAVAARALGTKDVVLAVEDEAAARSVRKAAAERRMSVRVVRLPERFISGESGAVIRAINGETPIPPGRKVLAADSGVDRRPTLLSNTETYAQLAVLASLGPDLYASVGTDSEPGTTLLTVGGTSVVEVPLGTSLGAVLERCDVTVGQGLLVGGYHGAWITPAAIPMARVSRAGMEAAGGVLGAGIILALTPGTCPLGEVLRIAEYLSGQSAGQCGPCRMGLPDMVRALAALADGSGGVEEIRHAAGVGRGRGACAHPDGTARFVLSALDVFAGDIAAHRRGGSCGLPVFGVLPLPVPTGAETRLSVDWTRCDGHGLCAYLVPELVRLDRYGYPVMLGSEIPVWLERDVQRAVSMCPALALRVTSALGVPASRGAGSRKK
ncbi:NADH-quinone oxidoreductase subunit I [Actinomadura craniellae]|uniref:NADH-quinone oxidoreductase subunit I n=1 Tax=Actinomadura craniellae TaxID=2231787 RepID=A0A365H4G1_9ACTN|nr:NADH-quinone oxidoreductase subunit NuoF family protein [Actinomadura craniellae]RAY13113.1 NADH-quinone oxidoreductase subunit I [Actinomadura craniellae]